MYSISHQTWRCHISHQLALHPIQLTPQELRQLLQLIQAHRTPQAIARRAQIVLTAHAHPDWSSKQLAQSLGLNDRLICKGRRRGPELEQGTWVICADEKTSIQAREAEQAPRPAMRKHAVSQSPRYHRRGALHLMAALSVADGLVYGQYHPRKRFVDFRSFLETVIVAEAHQRRVQTVALVLDNGPTHAPKQLTRWIERLSPSLEGKLTIQLYWLPKNASWLDQLEIWFTSLRGSLY